MSPAENPMLTVLNQLGADRPDLQPLLEMLRTQQLTQATDVTAEDDDGPTHDELCQQKEQLVLLLKRARHEIRRLDATVAALRQDLTATVRFQDELAAALGACPRCWGSDRGCDSCHGRGGPGSYPLDQPLFARYVGPAVRRPASAAPVS